MWRFFLALKCAVVAVGAHGFRDGSHASRSVGRAWSELKSDLPTQPLRRVASFVAADAWRLVLPVGRVAAAPGQVGPVPTTALL